MTNSIDSIRQRMREIRHDLGDDAEDLVESAHAMMDWRSYVRRYPWISLGVGVAIGYVAVPTRIEVLSPDADALLNLVKKNKLIVNASHQPQARNGLAATVLSLLASLATRAAIGYATRHLAAHSGDNRVRNDTND